MTRDELVVLVKGYIAGGNVVANNVCYGRVTEGVFVLTDEGVAAIADSAAKAPSAKKAARASKATSNPETSGAAASTEESPADLDDVDISDLDLD